MKAPMRAVLLVVICSVPVLLVGQRMSTAQREILALQDARSLGDGFLLSSLQNKDRDLRFRAAIALANIQDTTTVEPLVPLLQDQDVQVRAAAAFALGQIGTLPAQKALVATLGSEQDLTVLSRIFEALGKCGDGQALGATVSYIPSGRNMAVKRDQALAIARFAIRRITSERAVWLCYDLLNDNHAETRLAASYALWRFAPLGVLDLEISKRPEVLQKLMNDRDEEVRINVAALLGKTKSPDASGLVRLFSEIESKAPDWRVQVQLARAAAGMAAADPALFNVLMGFLESPNDHVQIAGVIAVAAYAPGTFQTSPTREDLLQELKKLSLTPSKSAPVLQGESMVAFARLFPQEFTHARTDIMKGIKSGLMWAKYIEAVSAVPTEQTLTYVLDCLADDTVRVQMAAWDFLPRMIRSAVVGKAVPDSFIARIPSILAERMHSSLKRMDMAVVTVVANAFADSTVQALCDRAGLRTEITSALAATYPRLSSQTDGEALQALQAAFVRLRDTASVPILLQALHSMDRTVAQGAANALRQLTGKEFSPVRADSGFATKTERDWKALEALPNGQRIVFRTTKGVFAIRLRKDVAPFTALTFYELVRKKFYDGLTFHRVVPDFVIQGGDPRGDGWGGPGFSIRSEWSLINFVRGSVGLASSGKDTEGSQFFITHVSTPHLDGRYTIFATVSSGMEVVDKIQVGDRILSAEAR